MLHASSASVVVTQFTAAAITVAITHSNIKQCDEPGFFILTSDVVRIRRSYQQSSGMAVPAGVATPNLHCFLKL
jgi:hypothetical protein